MFGDKTGRKQNSIHKSNEISYDRVKITAKDAGFKETISKGTVSRAYECRSVKSILLIIHRVIQ